MISEFDIIDRFFQKPTYNAIVGIGDDAAIVPASQNTEFAISTDTLVSGKHFFPDVNPYKLGYKSLAVNLSDMAAMGAKPRWALLALTLPKNLVAHDNAWLSEFSQGFFNLASTYQVELIGGDTTAERSTDPFLAKTTSPTLSKYSGIRSVTEESTRGVFE